MARNMARRRTDGAVVAAVTVTVTVATANDDDSCMLACLNWCVRVSVLLFLFRSSNCRSFRIRYCYVWCVFLFLFIHTRALFMRFNHTYNITFLGILFHFNNLIVRLLKKETWIVFFSSFFFCCFFLCFFVTIVRRARSHNWIKRTNEQTHTKQQTLAQKVKWWIPNGAPYIFQYY